MAQKESATIHFNERSNNYKIACILYNYHKFLFHLSFACFIWLMSKFHSRNKLNKFIINTIFLIMVLT